MQYISRELERKVLKFTGFFKAILVTGARQVGKTTMLKHLAEGENRTYVSMDNQAARELANRDPVLFFQTYEPPILIDEVQKAPILFERIKELCDETDKTGQFWLTGSQQYKMMSNVRESLAGRVGILTLYSMTQKEKMGIVDEKPPGFTPEDWKRRKIPGVENNLRGIYDHIWTGGMPQAIYADEELRADYFNSYVDTYLLRDAVEDGGISDYTKFRAFITACAALVSEQLNYAYLAEACGISQPTAREWIKILEGMGIVYLLKPFSNNAMKRLVKSPKLYFCDTGLCAFLSMWPSAATLMNGPSNGSFFENFVVMEFVKNYEYSKETANLTYYRDDHKKEIDLVIETGAMLHPIEIKRSSNPDVRDTKKFSLLDKSSIQRGGGGIVCMCEEPIPLGGDDCFIPANLI